MYGCLASTNTTLAVISPTGTEPSPWSGGGLNAVWTAQQVHPRHRERKRKAPGGASDKVNRVKPRVQIRPYTHRDTAEASDSSPSIQSSMLHGDHPKLASNDKQPRPRSSANQKQTETRSKQRAPGHPARQPQQKRGGIGRAATKSAHLCFFRHTAEGERAIHVFEQETIREGSKPSPSVSSTLHVSWAQASARESQSPNPRSAPERNATNTKTIQSPSPEATT